MLRDWIYNASLYMGLSDVCDYIDYLDAQREIDELKAADPDAQVGEIEVVVKPREFGLLVHFSNLVLKDVAKNGLDFVKAEEIYSNANCELDLTKLSKNICAVRSVSSWDGLDCTNRKQNVDNNDDLKALKVGLPNAKYTIIYAYVPFDNYDLFSEIDCPPSVSSQTLITGLCKEFALTQLQYDQYKMYRDLYNEHLEADRKPHSPVISSRGWI